MTFDQDFDYSFPLFSSLLKNEGREKENEIVFKSHAFLLDQHYVISNLDVPGFYFRGRLCRSNRPMVKPFQM